MKDIFTEMERKHNVKESITFIPAIHLEKVTKSI
jgi:hypothetical protein